MILPNPCELFFLVIRPIYHKSFISLGSILLELIPFKAFWGGTRPRRGAGWGAKLGVKIFGK